jgi:hypothetical protein
MREKLKNHCFAYLGADGYYSRVRSIAEPSRLHENDVERVFISTRVMGNVYHQEVPAAQLRFTRVTKFMVEREL